MGDRADHTRLLAFDMDGTLLNGRVISALGEKFGFLDAVEAIQRSSLLAYERSEGIARLLRGITPSEFLLVAAVPLMKGAEETVKTLKQRGYRVGIISDSYTLATEVIARRLKMDFHVANELEVQGNVLTGRLRMPMGWERIGCSCKQSVCKQYHLMEAARLSGVPMSNTVAVGDSASDLCMIENAGTGILFNPGHEIKLHRQQSVIEDNDLRLILGHLKDP